MIEVEGLAELNKRLTEVADIAPEVALKGAYAGALIVQGAAQRNVPVEYGNLRASAYVQRRSADFKVEVGFTSAYALFVHENMEVNKGKPRSSGLGTYWNPGGPKFLERAVNDNVRRITDLIESYLAEALRGQQPGQ